MFQHNPALQFVFFCMKQLFNSGHGIHKSCLATLVYATYATKASHMNAKGAFSLSIFDESSGYLTQDHTSITHITNLLISLAI